MPRQPDFDVDAVVGAQGEQLYRRLRTEILNGTAEVKFDRISPTTGNVYVKHECKGRDGRWYPSGISTTKAATWVFVLPGSMVLALPTILLKRMHLSALNGGLGASERDGSNPTRGVKLPLFRLVTWALALASQSTERKAA